ncbi:WD repeat-containing protein l(2)05287 [Lycorma delicatula]|uniref:WD repeat-containing protein l(2)05287 n=1 Tax=Lycorma delicatula TaxID=130591 RepID=UPI003F51701F
MTVADKLVLKRIVGGSVIERRPVFTPDEKNLFVLEKECIRSYSTKSGECVKEYFTVNGVDDVMGISIHNDILFGITSSGCLTKWYLQSTGKEQVVKLQLPNEENLVVFDINIIDHGTSESKISSVEICLFLSNIKDDNKFITVAIYNIYSLKMLMHYKLIGNHNIHSISVGGSYNEMFVCTIHKDILRVHNYKSSKPCNLFYSQKESEFTVVRAHPTENCVAVGNTNGRVYIFYNVTTVGRNYTQTLYAWHILPVSDISFTPSGTQMFTGGSECVLVKWTVGSPDIKHFLPRLSAPIEHLVISPNNTQTAISLKDNSILLINAQSNVTCTIQQFTWGLIPIPGQRLFSAGINQDPNSECLVLNGRPGHIQFFSIKTNSLLYNLDITETNYLTQEPNSKVYNFDITQVAFSQDGKWLATVEIREDDETSMEIHLKMWMFNSKDQRFKLNTVCKLPHQDKINTVKFQPLYSWDNEHQSEYCLVTTGDDKKFRVWISTINYIENNKYFTWKCERIGFYKDFIAGPAGFSSDGSVLAVGFGPCLTIWDLENHALVASLTRDNETLTFVEVEQRNYSHLVVSTSLSHLMVWNLLTLTVQWIVPLNVCTLIADPLSDFMAAFTSDNMLFVFKPSNPQPFYERKNICKDNSKILSAIFLPHSKPITGMPSWMHHSQLYFITSSQELFSVELEDNINKNQLKEFNTNEEDIIKTPFSMLKAKQMKIMEDKDSDKSSFKKSLIGLGSEKAIRKLLSVQIHTTPGISNFCNDFLTSFITQSSNKMNVKKKKKKKRNKKIISDNKISDDHLKNTHIDDKDYGNLSTNYNISKINSSFDKNSKKKKKNYVKNLNRKNTSNDNNKSPIKIRKNKTKRKRKRSKSEEIKHKEGFVIDEAADLGLLNLFKNE